MNEIRWSTRAQNDYFSILSYLQERWGQKSLQDFADRVQQAIEIIRQNPYLFQASGKKKNVRRCVLRKQVSLYFRVTDDQIELITFFDSRRNPRSKKL